MRWPSGQPTRTPSYIDFPQLPASPKRPRGGFSRLFTKLSDGLAYILEPDGTETAVGGAGGGGTNFAQFTVPSVNATQSGGAWTIVEYGDISYSTAGFQSSGAQNDSVSVSIYMEAGTYTVFVTFRKSTNTGIITVNLDAASQGTIDTYAAAAAYGTGSVTGISVSAGSRTWEFKMATKNASSSSYYGELFYVTIYRTA